MTQRRVLDIETKRAEFEATAVPLMKTVYNAALRLTHAPEDASDLVQETYLRAYRTFENFAPGTNCKAWLLTVMYSVYINEYRRSQRRGTAISLDDLEERFQRYLEAPADAEEGATTVAAWGIRVGPEVEGALKGLPPDFRTPVLLVDVAGLSYDEAAAVLRCPVGTVRSRLFRARRLLFGALQDYAAQAGFSRGDK